MLHREVGLENKQAGGQREVVVVHIGGCTLSVGPEPRHPARSP